MNKRRLGLLVMFGLVGLLVLGCAGMSDEVKKPKMSFVVTTPVVELNPNARVTMYGTGFAPKQEVQLLFVDASGGSSIIMVETLNPKPVPNKEGAWATVWNCGGDYLKTIAIGTAMISVIDKELEILAQAPVVFNAPPKKPAPKKEEPKKDAPKK
jgi:hypothetical protein